MSFKFSRQSLDRLVGVHPDLVGVMHVALQRSSLDMTILEGTRTVAQQQANVASGASQTMYSDHLLTEHETAADPILLCRAVDVAPFLNGSASWHWPHYDVIALIIKDAAAELGIEIRWGGDWSSFRDGPHWYLP